MKKLKPTGLIMPKKLLRKPKKPSPPKEPQKPAPYLSGSYCFGIDEDDNGKRAEYCIDDNGTSVTDPKIFEFAKKKIKELKFWGEIYVDFTSEDQIEPNDRYSIQVEEYTKKMAQYEKKKQDYQKKLVSYLEKQLAFDEQQKQVEEEEKQQEIAKAKEILEKYNVYPTAEL